MIRTIIAAGLIGLPFVTAAPALADSGDVSCSPCVIRDQNGLPLWDETLDNFRQAPGRVVNNWANMPQRAAAGWGGMPQRVVDGWGGMPQRAVDGWGGMPQRAVDNWSGNSG